MVKSAIGFGQKQMARVGTRQLFAEASPGDVILFAGENWNGYDFDTVRDLRAAKGIRIAAVLQDMIPHVHPQFFESAEFIRRFHSYVNFLATGTDLVLAISDSTRDDFLRAVPEVAAERVVRIELGADFATAGNWQPPDSLTLPSGRDFVLSVSTIQARKNFDLLYRLWRKFALDGRRNQPHLVIVGKPGFASADLLHMMRHDPLIADTVTILHGPSDAELGWLYRECLFTLYPSWYEGWGLPLSESLAFGKTFIASDTSSLPEAGQGLGIHIDPFDATAWEREILALADDPDRLAAMEQRIETERRMTSWADCALSIAKQLEKI